MLKKLVVLFILAAFPYCLFSQSDLPPFWDDIKAFRKEDSLHAPSGRPILLVGSSSFTLWKNVQQYFPTHTLLNRGFGGSTLVDQIFYFNEIIRPYSPKQIIIYCGENDFFNNSSLGVDSVVSRFKKLFFMIRKYDSKVPIAFISIKPSPSRKGLNSKFMNANNQIQLFLKAQKKASFIDVYHKMIDAQGRALKNIFLADSLHMNTSGYAIWQKTIQPFLKK